VDAPVESAADEAARLRRCLNDFVSVMALPALWAGGEPPQIVSTLLDALLGMLRLAFVFVRLNDPEGGPSIEMMRVAESLEGTVRVRERGDAIDSSLRDAPLKWPPRARVSIGSVNMSVACARLGLQAEIGVVVAGSWKLDFPAETERMLLRMSPRTRRSSVCRRHAS
jgi:hypothetical protein